MLGDVQMEGVEEEEEEETIIAVTEAGTTINVRIIGVAVDEAEAMITLGVVQVEDVTTAVVAVEDATIVGAVEIRIEAAAAVEGDKITIRPNQIGVKLPRTRPF